MKIKDAKKPCKMGAGTRGLGRRPWEPRTERPALIWGLFAGASRGGKGGNRCSPRLQAARFPTPLHARPPGELLPPPALCSHLLLERIWEVHGRFLTRVLPNGIAYRSCLGVRAERWSGLPARGWYLPHPPPPISARILEVQVGSWELSSVASGPVQRLCVWSANR